MDIRGIGRYQSMGADAIFGTRTIAESRGGKPGEDRISFSSRAVISSQRTMMGLDPDSIEVSLPELEKIISQDLNALEKKLRMLAGGINVSLGIGSQGEVLVGGNHPKREQLQVVLNESADVVERMRRLSSDSRFLKAARENSAFMIDESDPGQMVADFIQTMGRARRQPFSLNYSGGRITSSPGGVVSSAG